MKEQLAKVLEGLAPGETFILGYDLFDSIWPPGFPDQTAMSDFSLFAEITGATSTIFRASGLLFSPSVSQRPHEAAN
jgi:hypothetical protein